MVALGGADIDQPGLLPSDASPDQIDAALRGVAAGLVGRPVEADGFDAVPERSVQNLLTPREIEVLSAIAYGLSNKAIARRLSISLHTVKFHIESPDSTHQKKSRSCDRARPSRKVTAHN
jgi:DNA-binding NarL/FixJ family response regulator